MTGERAVTKGRRGHGGRGRALQCREKVVAQLQSFEIEAKTKAMNETAYQQTRISYDEKITLLEAARQKCSDWQEAEQKLADLQNTEQEKWCSTFRLDVGITCTGLILFIASLICIIRSWLDLHNRVGVLVCVLVAFLLCSAIPISELNNF